MRPTTILPILVSAAALAGCGPQPPRTASPAAAPIPVHTAAIALQQWPGAYEATGTVRARTVTVLSSKVMAYVRQIDVQIGDRVREGQLVVTLDSQDLDAQVRLAESAEAAVASAIPEADHAAAGAQANLGLAQSTYARMSELADKKSISPHEFDESNAALKSAQAAYDMARARRAELDSKRAQAQQAVRAAAVMRDYTSISAPFAGLVIARSAEPGTLAAPGAPLLTVEREGAYRLEASVDESQLPFVKTGQTVEVSLDSGPRLSARVSEIVPAVDAASRAYIVKIDLPATPNLRSGLFGRAWFPKGARSVLAVPPDALIERGQLQSVFVVEGGAAHSRLVTTGERTPSAIEALSGLSAGEMLVSPAPPGLADGARVEPRP